MHSILYEQLFNSLQKDPRGSHNLYYTEMHTGLNRIRSQCWAV